MAGSVGDVLHQQHVHQFVEIGFDAARLVEVGIDGNRHARDFRLFRASHGQRVDIEGAAAKQRCHAGQHARLVFDVHHECIQHIEVVSSFGLVRVYSSSAVSTIGLGRRIISCSAAPAATIG